MRKEMRRLIALAVKQGYTVELRNNGHYKFIAPSGMFFFASSTPSDHRALLNLKADLRKTGLK